MAFGQCEQACFTIKAAIVKPIGVVHGNAFAAAAVVNLHQKAVLAFSDCGTDINKEGC